VKNITKMTANYNANYLADKSRLTSVMGLTLLASFICHFCFIPLFLWLDVHEMVVLNIYSSIVLALSVFLVQRRLFVPAFILGTGELIIHAILAVHFIGWGSGFHYFLIVLTPFIFFWPYWNIKTKIAASSFLMFLYVLLFYYSKNSIPVQSMTAWKLDLTTIVTAFTAFLVFAAVAFYYQVSVNQVEANLLGANKRLEELARTDPLTELHNRRIIEEKIGEENDRRETSSRNFSIIMSDIDYFKALNDTYGHQIGDLVLVSISKILKGASRTGDVVARWGGEEFLILLQDTGGAEAREVAERMRIAISQAPIYIDDNDIQITMTFGVAECSADTGISDCIARADKALYEGKAAGRNMVILDKV
jgi:diguanylate cyclase (GGDEF)-like protein